MSKQKNKKLIGKNPIREFFIAYPAVAIIILLIILFSTLAPGFLRISTFRNAMKGNAYLLVAAVAETIVLLTGGIDLSVSTVMAFSAVVSCLYMGGVETVGVGTIVMGLIVALGAGLIFGMFNGVLIGYLGMQPFIVTMGTRLIAEGVAVALTKSVAVPGPESMVMFGFKNLLGIPIVFLLAVIILIIVAIGVKQSGWGRKLILLGSNRESARYCGINVRRVEALAYTFSGLLSGLAGFFTIIVLGNALPTIGSTNLLVIIGAVVLGGTSMAGGEGSIERTFIGIALFAILTAGLNAIVVPYTIQMIIEGLIIFVGYSLSVNVTAKSVLAVK